MLKVASLVVKLLRLAYRDVSVIDSSTAWRVMRVEKLRVHRAFYVRKAPPVLEHWSPDYQSLRAVLDNAGG